ncbi:MAG: DUF4838 domain-containing protein [Clostridia bacterium]|nr:DUF4838 domain-containing protein [Clostridia bacterium]
MKQFGCLLLCFSLLLSAAACGANPPADISDGTSNKATTTSSTTVSSASTTALTDAASSFATTTKAPTKSTIKTTANKGTTTTTKATKPTEEPKTDTLNLAVDGKSTYVIVVSENATDTERTAASELRSYFSDITGCRLSIKKDSEAPTVNEIVIGKTNREKSGEFDRAELGNDGFVIKTVDKKLFLAGGGDRGTLYAVYEFLEAYLGCRFYTIGAEKVPKTKTIVLDPIGEDKQIPAFEYRCVYWGEYRDNDIAVKRKLSGSTKGAISEEWGGSIDYADDLFVHTFNDFVPPNEYWASHPEYFRLTANGDRDPAQLCLSNPDVLKIITEKVRKHLADNPNAELISVSQEDTTPGNCHCESCRKVDTAEGSPVGTMLHFVNAVARDIKEDFPQVKIHTLAYQYTRTPPKTVRPDDNVVVQLCDIECCFSHPLVMQCDASSNSFYNDLKKWSAITDNLYIWDYTTDYAHYNVTFPNFNVLRDNIRLFADNNVLGVFEQGAYQSVSGEFGELRSYLLAKCLWDPYMTAEEFSAHMDDFLQGVYGEGGKYLREYIDHAQELVKNTHFGTFASVETLFYPSFVKTDDNRALPADLTFDKIQHYTSTDWEPFINWYTQMTPNSIIACGEDRFAKAMAAAETEQQKMRLDRAFIQVEYLRSFYYYHYYKEYVRTDMAKLINAYFAAHPSGLTAEEIAAYSDTVSRHVEMVCSDKYRQYNQALAQKLYSYKIHRHEGDVDAQFVNPNLDNPPSRW